MEINHLSLTKWLNTNITELFSRKNSNSLIQTQNPYITIKRIISVIGIHGEIHNTISAKNYQFQGSTEVDWLQLMELSQAGWLLVIIFWLAFYFVNCCISTSSKPLHTRRNSLITRCLDALALPMFKALWLFKFDTIVIDLSKI